MVLGLRLNGVSKSPRAGCNETHVAAFRLPSFRIRLELSHPLEVSFHLLLALLDSVLLGVLCSVWAYLDHLCDQLVLFAP